MADEEGAPAGATLLDLLAKLESQGYTEQFAVTQDGKIRCGGCDVELEAEQLQADVFLRAEGASDPDDMVAVAGLTCPGCDKKGTIVLKYGPEASPEDSHVLSALGPGPTT